MSSQEQEENRVVLQSKDLNQLLTMANLDVKLNKNAVLKISITDAIKTVRQDMPHIKIRMYGNIVHAIPKGILRIYNTMILDLRETIDLMRKNIKPTKREEEAAAGRLPKTAKKDRITIPTLNTTETKDEQVSVGSIEKPLHTSARDKITVIDRFTPLRMPNFEVSRDSLHPQLDFSVQIEGFDAQPVDFPTSAMRNEGQIPFDFPTTPGKALPLPDFISPAKPKQTFPSLDIYLESVRKGKDTIFEEEEEKVTDDSEDDEAQNRRRRENRNRRTRRVDLNPDLETRWDYDERPEIVRIEEERQVTDAAIFIQKVQAPTVPVAEQRFGVNVDHFLDSFTPNALDRFNQKVRDLQEEQVRAGTEASGRDRQFLDTITRSRIQPEEPSGFAGIAGDFGEPSGAFMDPFEDMGGVKERKLFEPSVLEGIGLFLDEQQLDEKESTSEVYEKVQSLTSRISGAKKVITFESLVENETRISKANTFYELMNLAKSNRVNITQSKPFDDIEISTVSAK